MTYPTTPDESEAVDNPVEEGAEPPPPSLDEATAGSAPETVNLVGTLSPEALRKYGEDVVRLFEADWQASSKYRERRASIMRLALGQLPPAPDDGFGYARVHYPIIMTAVLRMHARIYDQQLPSSGEFFGCKPTDQNDLDRAIRVAKHLNWQCEHQIPEYAPNHDNLIMQWLLYGSAFSIMYWNPATNRPCHEACRTEDIVLPYTEDDKGDPHLSTVSRITRILRFSRHELEDFAATGYYDAAAVAKLYEEEDKQEGEAQVAVDQSTRGSTRENDHPMREVIDEAQGVKRPLVGGPRELLEQHHWCKLEGQDKQRPVITVVDRVTKSVLGIFLREDEDPADRARFNREKAANEAAYQAALMKFKLDLQAYYSGGQTITPPPMPGTPGVTAPPMGGEQTMTAPPMPGATDMTAPPMSGETTATIPGMPPQPPAPPPEPTPPKMVPINFFTHYKCVPNPEGIYGWGIGFLLEGHNLVADTIAAQLVDAGTLSNIFTFMYSKYAKLSRGDLKVKPGQGVEVDLTPEQMKNAIVPITFPGPNPAMGQVIKDQKEEAEELSGAGEILSGEVGGSNETATTTQIRISQALAAIGILSKRYTRSRTAEAKSLARLNSVYLGDQEYFYVVDPTKPGVVQQQNIARMDYLQDTEITVTADPRMASQPQRVAEAQTALQAVMANPLTAADPLMVAAAQKILFKAMDQPTLVAALDSLVQKMSMGLTPPGMAGGGAPGGAKPANPQAQPQGPAVPMPKRVPNGGPAPTNGMENGQVT